MLRALDRAALSASRTARLDVVIPFDPIVFSGIISMHSIPVDPRLLALGWTPFFHQQFLTLLADAPHFVGYEAERIVADRGKEYALLGPSGPRRGVLAGRLARELMDDARPCVGDFVLVPGRGAEHPTTDLDTPGELARIEHVFERASVFRRKAAGPTSAAQAIAANVDVAVVVSALAAPDADPHASSHGLNPARLLRYLHAIRDAPARPVIALNKADLNPAAEAEAEALARALHISEVLAVSAESGYGFERLASHLGPGVTAVFVGSSGVGKSSLINAWLGGSVQRTGSVRDSDTRGRHTTTHRELFVLENGGLLIDTPGMREFGLFAGGASELEPSGFEDVDAFARDCRFRDCTHTSEPGCAVLAAIEHGALEPLRLEQAQKLVRELDWQSRRHDALKRLTERRQNRARSRAVRAAERLKKRED